MDFTDQGEELCNTGTEEETLALQKKRSRRVSFADITSVHVFDRDEDSRTPPASKSTPDSHTPNNSFITLGFAKASPGSGDSNDQCSNDDDQNDYDDDEEDERKSFFRPMYSPSPGSTLGSITSNDDDNFFGPVSSSFIRPRNLSDSEELDENHDITMDSTAFSMHFHSLARSDSGGCASKTPTMTRLTFDEKTPTQITGGTNVGSSMELIKDDTRACGSSAQTNRVNHSGSPNDMSLVGENSRKYDFENLSTDFDDLLAEGSNDLGEGFSPDRKNLITASAVNSTNNIYENHVGGDEDGIPIITAPKKRSAEKQSASRSGSNILKKESTPSILETFNFSSLGVTGDPKVQTPTHIIKEKSLYQDHQVVKAAIENSRLKLISAVNSTTFSPGFNMATKLNMQQDNKKTSPLERYVEKKSEMVENDTISKPSHMVMSTPLSTDGIRKVFFDSDAPSNPNRSIHSHGKSKLSFDKEIQKIVKREPPNESNLEHSPGYFSRNSTDPVLENNKKINMLPDFRFLKQERHHSLKKRDMETYADGHFHTPDNVSRWAKGEDLRVGLFQHEFSTDTFDMERPTKFLRTAVSSVQYTPTEKDNIRASGMIHTLIEKRNFRGLPPISPSTFTNLISGTDPSRISKGNLKEKSFFGSDLLHARSKSIINQKTQVSPSLKNSENRQRIDSYNKGLNIFNKMQDMGNLVGMMRNSESSEAEVVRNECNDVNISLNSARDISSNLVKNEGNKAFQHCSDLFAKLSVYEKQLISPNAHKLKIHEISQVEDAFRQHQMIKTKEMLCFDINSQKFNDTIVQANQRRIWQSRLLLDKVVFELAKRQLLSMKREKLMDRVHFLTSKVEECLDLKYTLLNHSNSVGIEDPQVEQNRGHSYVSDENQKDYRDKVQTLRGEVDASDKKITNYLKLFPTNYPAMGKTSDIIESLRDYIEKLDRCSILRQTVQLWCIDNAENKNGHHSIQLNYCSLIFQSISIPVLVSTTVIFSNKINNTEISKRFPGVEACTAFVFVFGNTMHKHIGRQNMPTETQITSSLLSNLLDVIEEVQLARIELKNLIRAKFFCPSDKQLCLELQFISIVGGLKAVLTLDMTTLNRGVYPSHLLPHSTNMVSSGAASELFLRKMEATVVGIEPGYLRVLRLCRHVSSALVHSLTC